MKYNQYSRMRCTPFQGVHLLDTLTPCRLVSELPRHVLAMLTIFKVSGRSLHHCLPFPE